ncbi:hypothetical protein LOTGIDRAFT_164015 [Lottia gigantea]|uniref:Limulus clotting factor C n=1 Tax=Lottia gigantea TaxID=225164 RepID=V4A1B0_LOTGI|nr:hypothetical protein LOTGIDRAFT_164015 [Lottia gigantea]ESO90432.1 hypothetical protein LOTGIDRAFT_164015 [Lottia gigantea]
MAGIIGCIVVFTATFLLPSLVVTSSCHPRIVTCRCGKTTVDIHIKRCMKITAWGATCKPCEKYRKSQLCAKYRHCVHCDADGCLKCKKGWYGTFCREECRCENGGSCDHHGDCQCLPGYIGGYCQTKILKDCGSPNIPVYGEVILTNTTEGSIASFKCPPNFLLIGQVNQTCLDTGQWSGKAPVCEYSCPVPKVSSHLVVQPEPVKHMSDDYVISTYHVLYNVELIRQVRFSCEEDYEIQGRQLLYCLPDGTWDSSPPICVRKCKPPPQVRDGEVLKGNLRSLEGDTIEYRCHDNFRIEDHSTLTCMNGSWDSTPPRCVPKIQCDQLEAENGHITYSDNDRMVGSEAILRCYSGYIKSSSDDYKVCGQDGQWKGEKFECVEKEEEVMLCDEHDGPEHGGVDEWSESHYEYICEEGYFISGETQNYCIDGEWIHDIPKCVQRTTCKAVDKPDGCSVCFGDDCSKLRHASDCLMTAGDIVLPEDRFMVGTVMEFRYDRMLFQLFGSRRRVCQSDGVWSGRTTTCVPRCGIHSFTRKIGVTPRIRMGLPTSDGKWPWQVGIIWDQDNLRLQCGGSLISEDMVLTAAHCVESASGVKKAEEIMVHVGTVSLTGKHRQLVKVKRIIKHEDYFNHGSFDSDIALIQLHDKLTISTTIRPVCLPDPLDSEDYVINDTNLDHMVPMIRNLTGVEGVVIGWGLTENGSSPDILKMTNVKIADQNECIEFYERSSTNMMNITDKMLCAVGSNPTKADACSGDSGGPLLVEDDSGRWTVVGIVSFGLFNCSMSVEERYGFYTRVEKFLPWIHHHL